MLRSSTEIGTGWASTVSTQCEKLPSASAAGLPPSALAPNVIDSLKSLVKLKWTSAPALAARLRPIRKKIIEALTCASKLAPILATSVVSADAKSVSE